MSSARREAIDDLRSIALYRLIGATNGNTRSWCTRRSANSECLRQWRKLETKRPGRRLGRTVSDSADVAAEIYELCKSLTAEGWIMSW